MYKAVFLHRKSKTQLKKGLDRVPVILVGNGLLFDVMFFFSIFFLPSPDLATLTCNSG